MSTRNAGEVDFTFMYAAHDAFHRDLRRLVAAVDAGRSADPAVRTGWTTFKNQLHVHHTAEDRWLWPALRAKVTRPEEASVLDAMEAEHLDLEPLLSQVDAALIAGDLAVLAEGASALATALTAHMEHEEEYALPLVEAHLGAQGWGAPTATSKRLLNMLPPPARLLYRALWRPSYARTPRWVTEASPKVAA
jgi:iron-sulfur cluster repair protein YtfE (RIC family)